MRLLLPLLMASAVRAAPDASAVSAVLDDWHDAAAKADEARYFGNFAADAVFLGTDGTERWDVPAFRAYARPHFAKGTGWTLKPSERSVSFSEDGRTAWFDEKVLSPSYGPSRGSGVLVFKGGRWLIAQYNLSVPVPNGLLMKVAGMVKAGWPAAGGLDAKAAAALLEARRGDKDFVLLDVRTSEEFARGRIAGAVNVDFQAADFKERLSGLDKTKAYLVHCAVGGRSKKASDAMTAAGFGTVYDLLGGLTAWEKAGLPVER